MSNFKFKSSSQKFFYNLNYNYILFTKNKIWKNK